MDKKEHPRVSVTLATGISQKTCEQINLGYRDPRSITPSDYADRETEGILMVPQAGEVLYQLAHPPAWARPDVLETVTKNVDQV